jgi:signal transduction histidine kinase/ligand-binding sensor domain-containing protein
MPGTEFASARLVRSTLTAVLLLAPVGIAVAQVDVRPDLPAVGGSEAPSIRLENMGLSDGLAQGTIYDIIQDRHGYIWFGTQGGLHRYDGQNFAVFKPKPFDTTSISDGWVMGIDEGRDGSLWLATHSGGLSRMDPVTGRFDHYRHDPADPESVPDGLLNKVLEASDGTVWIGSRHGLSRLDADRTGRFTHYRHDPSDPNSLSGDYVGYLHEDPRGFLWIATDNGLSRLDPGTGRFTRYMSSQEAATDWGSAQQAYWILQREDRPETIWVGTGQGAVTLDIASGETERLLPYPSDPSSSSRNAVWTITSDPNDPDVLWMGTIGGGLVRLDTRSREFFRYPHDPGDPTSPASEWISTVFADRSGTMWVGTGGRGIGKFNPQAVDIVSIRHDPEDPDGIMTDGAPWGIYEDPERRLWIGTIDYSGRNWLTRYDLETGEVDRTYSLPDDPSTPWPGFILSIRTDSRGRLWVGSQGGLAGCDPETLRCIRIPNAADGGPGLGPGTAKALYESPREPGILWVGTTGAGLHRLDIATGEIRSWSTDPLDPGSGPRRGSVIMEDAAGTLWMGSLDRGLARFDRETETFTVHSHDPADTTSLASNHIEAIAERASEPGVLWLATFAGLDRFDLATGTVTHYDEDDGLAFSSVYSVMEDGEGQLWMSTNLGISSFDPDTEIFRNYGLDDGLAELEAMQNGYARGAGGVMYFGNVSGITAFIPSRLSTNPVAPPVALATLRVRGHVVNPGPGSVLSRPLVDTDSILLPYAQNEFSVDFAGLHFADPTRNSYSWRLDGYDAEWSEPSFQRTATYTNLPPGEYTLRVRAANPDGVWNEEGASLHVTVLPPWWRTTWAYVLFALLLAGSVFGVDRLQRFRLLRKERERAAIQEAELRAEAAEAESKALQAENERKKNIERIGEIGKEITASLDFETIFGRLYEHVNELIEAPIFGVGVYLPDENVIDYRLAIEEGKRYTPYRRDATDRNQFPVWCIENRAPVFINDVETEYSKYIDHYEHETGTLEDGTVSQAPRSLMYLPLMTQDRVLGVITVQSANVGAYTEDDLNLLKTMAAYASVALDNADAYRRLNGTVAELRQTQQQLVQQEKMASLGQLTAGIAHEIKNPLNFVNNFADVNAELASELRELVTRSRNRTIDEVGAELEELVSGLQLNARQISKHGQRADAIVRGMMEHARQGDAERYPVAVNDFVEEYVNLARHGMRAARPGVEVEIVRDYAEDVGNATIAPQEMGRVVVNLVTNAYDAMESVEAPKLTVATRRRGGQVEIRITDNGPGIPDDIRAKIFEPFFTTKPTGKGTGLGLSLSHDVVTQGHGGTMTVEAAPGGGASFVVRIPS